LLDGVVSFDLFGLPTAEAKARLLQQIGTALTGRAKPATEPVFPGSLTVPEQQPPSSPPDFPTPAQAPDRAPAAVPPPHRAPPNMAARVPRSTTQQAPIAPDVYTDPDYTDALAAFFTERWPAAVVLFAWVQARHPDDRRVADRLAEARRHQHLDEWSAA